MRTSQNDWLDDALCKGGQAWFPYDDDDVLDPEGVRSARAVCDVCPVRTDCHLEAQHYERNAESFGRHGVWAGLTPAQRASAVRRGTVTCHVCAAGLDPSLVRDGVVRCPRDRRHLDRVLPPIPEEGDEWSKRHTALARRVLAFLDEPGLVPRPRTLANRWEIREQDMARVFQAFVMDGTLRRTSRGDYRRTKRAARVEAQAWQPPHLVGFDPRS